MNGKKEYRWRKIKKEDIHIAGILLFENESNYVSACGRFIARSAEDSVWVLSGKKGEVAALAVNSRSTLIPVLGGINNVISIPEFPLSSLRSKKIHSLQGVTEEVILFEKTMEKTGRKIMDRFDYDLMGIDKYPQMNRSKSFPENLTLRVPTIIDLDAIIPLQAAYEKEEVIPKGSSFNPAACRINTANIISNGRILTALLGGRFVGKIHVNAVSFTRYQVGGVYVHPDFRGQGIARKMTFEFITSLVNDGRGVTLFVKKTNMPAQKLYTGLGFSVKSGYRITYY